MSRTVSLSQPATECLHSHAPTHPGYVVDTCCLSCTQHPQQNHASPSPYGNYEIGGLSARYHTRHHSRGSPKSVTHTSPITPSHLIYSAIYLHAPTTLSACHENGRRVTRQAPVVRVSTVSNTHTHTHTFRAGLGVKQLEAQASKAWGRASDRAAHTLATESESSMAPN